MRPESCIPEATPIMSNKHANIDSRPAADLDPEPHGRNRNLQFRFWWCREHGENMGEPLVAEIVAITVRA